jgi:hypothetical protein
VGETEQPAATETDAAGAPASTEDVTAPDVGAPAEGGQPATGDQPAGDAPAASDPDAPAGGKPAAAPDARAARQASLTGRLAELSTARREAERKVRVLERERDEARQQSAAFGQLLQQARAGDKDAIPKLFEAAGLDFQKVVEFYAAEPGQGAAPATPEAKAIAAVADLQAKFAAWEKDRDEAVARNTATAREAQRLEHVAAIGKTIAKNSEKFEISARLGDEAAEAVFAEVVNAWEKAGRPALEPGEYDDAVLAAIDYVELQYEERGRKLAKQGKKPATGEPAATPAGAAAGAEVKLDKDTGLPEGLAGGKLSETDEQILAGLIDKTAPGANSQRAKPRTINSQLGGSAPPKLRATGDMDPREAFRALLPQIQSSPLA